MNLPDGAQVWQQLGQANAWTLDQHFGRMIIDRLNVANWQRSKDGSEGKNQPEPLPAPGDEPVDKADTAVAQALAFRARQAAKAQEPGGVVDSRG